MFLRLTKSRPRSAVKSTMTSGRRASSAGGVAARRGTDERLADERASSQRGPRASTLGREDGHAVFRNDFVSSHDAEVLGERLRDQNAIEGVAVVKGQILNRGSVPRRHGKLSEPA